MEIKLIRYILFFTLIWIDGITRLYDIRIFGYFKVFYMTFDDL